MDQTTLLSGLSRATLVPRLALGVLSEIRMHQARQRHDQAGLPRSRRGAGGMASESCLMSRPESGTDAGPVGGGAST
jgi:hypothetical protein